MDLFSSPSSIALFGKMVEGLGVPVEIATTEAHVPSFMVGNNFFRSKKFLEERLKDDIVLILRRNGCFIS